MDTRKKGILFIAAGVGAVVFFALFLTLSSSRTNTKKAGIPNPTSFYSPLTQSNEEIIINYGGSAERNADAVVTQYRFFGADEIPLTAATKKELLTVMPGYLRDYIQPVLGYTYIHVVKDTVKQTDDQTYSFDFYVDSNEGYFHIDKQGAGSSIGNPVTQIPWEGIE